MEELTSLRHGLESLIIPAMYMTVARLGLEDCMSFGLLHEIRTTGR